MVLNLQQGVGGPRANGARGASRLDGSSPASSAPLARSTGGGGGGIAAKDALGNDVKLESWLKTHPKGDHSLAQGLKVSRSSSMDAAWMQHEAAWTAAARRRLSERGVLSSYRGAGPSPQAARKQRRRAAMGRREHHGDCMPTISGLNSSLPGSPSLNSAG
jgi:hypothetical protein